MLYDFLDAIEIFLDKGGVVLYAILGLTLILWFFITERYTYLYFESKKDKESLCSEYRLYHNDHSWRGTKVREQLIHKYKASLKDNIPIIKTLLVIAPFMGLLGTVVGMIEIFDVMAITGNNDAKSMASGVARATIPTMAGMVISISGVFLVSRYESSITTKIEDFEEVL